MKKFTKYLVVYGNKRKTFDTRSSALQGARELVITNWLAQAPGSRSFYTAVARGWETFLEANETENVKQFVQTREFYVTSDGTEFDENTSANMHEFGLALKALAKQHDISAVDIVALAQSVQTEMFNEE